MKFSFPKNRSLFVFLVVPIVMAQVGCDPIASWYESMLREERASELAAMKRNLQLPVIPIDTISRDATTDSVSKSATRPSIYIDRDTAFAVHASAGTRKMSSGEPAPSEASGEVDKGAPMPVINQVTAEELATVMPAAHHFSVTSGADVEWARVGKFLMTVEAKISNEEPGPEASTPAALSDSSVVLHVLDSQTTPGILHLQCVSKFEDQRPSARNEDCEFCQARIGNEIPSEGRRCTALGLTVTANQPEGFKLVASRIRIQAEDSCVMLGESAVNLEGEITEFVAAEIDPAKLLDWMGSLDRREVLCGEVVLNIGPSVRWHVVANILATLDLLAGLSPIWLVEPSP